METSTIIIIAVIAMFALSFLAMIPIAIMNKKKSQGVDKFKQDNINKAILYLYATNPTIDGVKVQNLNFIKGEAGSGITIVALEPGKHVVEAKYETTSVSMLGNNQNYKTPKPIACEIDLAAGYEHNIGIYFYSPQERYSYYKGDVGEVVGGTALNVTGVGGFSQAYVLCYREQAIGAAPRQ